jgi:GNAT superfamily N-acetyltransferase
VNDGGGATIDRLGVGDGARLRAIRLRALSDAPEAFGTTLAEAVARPAEDWDSQLEQLATFIAAAGGDDVGLVRGARHDGIADAGYLISMWVAPEHRRRGIGSALAGAVVQWARTGGLRRVFLDVGERNVPAIALYAHQGFVPDGAIGTLPPPREHVREIRMVLTL